MTDVLEYIAKQRQPVTVREIAFALGRDFSDTWHACADLYEAGKICEGERRKCGIAVREGAKRKTRTWKITERKEP